MKGKILITGASGFIGSHLVELLLEKKIDKKSLRLFVPHNESLVNLPKEKIEIIRGDIRNKTAIKKAMKGVNLIFHLAALTIDGGKYFSQNEYNEVNVLGTQILLDECRGKKIKKFIFFSSIAVYGFPAWVGQIKNWDEKRRKDPQEIYGQSKLDAENKVIEAHKMYGTPYVIIRPTSVYGPRDKRNLMELFKVIKKHLFFYIGNGKNKMDYVYVKDVARAAYLAAFNKRTSGDYIIGSGNPLTLNEIAYYVAKSMNTVVINLHIPKTFAMILSILVKYISDLLGITPILFPQRVKVLTTDCYYNISKAKKELNFKPEIPFEEGSRLTSKWLYENKII